MIHPVCFKLLLLVGITLLPSASMAWDNCAFRILGCFTSEKKTELTKLQELSQDKKTLIIVNAHSSGGNFYAERARELYGQDINIIHLQSEKKPPSGTSYFRRELYDVHLVRPHYSIEELTDALKPFTDLHIVNGSSNTPLLWPELASRLKLPAVPVDMIPLVNHKHNNSQHLKKHGVQPIKEKAFKDAQTAWEWAQEHLTNHKQDKVMLKLVNSAGSEGVQIISSKSEFFAFFKKHLGKRNHLLRKNTDILVQRYIDRTHYTEYVIDAVADPKNPQKAVITDILTYTKAVTATGHQPYMTTQLENPAVITQGMWNKFQTIADAQIQAYQAKSATLHTEVFVKNSDIESNASHPEVLFIETDLRPAGGLITQLVHESGGTDMVTAHLYSIFEPDKFDQLRQAQRYQFDQHAIQVDLLGPQTPGIVTQMRTLEEMQTRLPGLKSRVMRYAVGDWVVPKIKKFSHAGTLHFVGSAEEIEEAEAKVREWERAESDNFYLTRPGNIKENFFYFIIYRRHLKPE